MPYQSNVRRLEDRHLFTIHTNSYRQNNSDSDNDKISKQVSVEMKLNPIKVNTVAELGLYLSYNVLWLNKELVK